MRRGSLFWALVLVGIGLALLLSNLGVLQANVGRIIWPGLLVLVGAFMLWRAVSRPPTPETQHAAIPLENTARAQVQLRFGAGRLNVSGTAADDQLLEGDFAGGVELNRRVQGDVASVTLQLPGQDWARYVFPWSGWQPPMLEWRMGLSNHVPMTLDIETGANESRIDLSEVMATDLTLKTGASATDVTLPAHAGQTMAQVEAGMASVEIHVPPSTSARVHAEGGMSNINIDTQRFPRLNGFYESPDYAQATNRIDLHIKVGMGAVNVH
jgi:N-terminal domain of toast_rack, DUF2154/Domain of unknown function (DUF5668)/Cell wall-active antibiotics response 4TMS YvqF